MPRELTVDGHEYVIADMDLPTKWRVTKRVLRAYESIQARYQKAMASLTPEELQRALKEVDDNPPTEEERAAAMRSQLRQALVEMDEAESEVVMGHALRAVQRRDPGSRSLAPVARGGGLTINYQDMDLAGMIELSVESIAENCGGFLLGGRG